MSPSDIPTVVYSIELLEATINKQVDRIDRYEEALQRIVSWADAYPLTVFPEPDWKRARDALALVGITLDSISAACMRHVVDGAGEIARRALAPEQGQRMSELHERPDAYGARATDSAITNAYRRGGRRPHRDNWRRRCGTSKINASRQLANNDGNARIHLGTRPAAPLRGGAAPVPEQTMTHLGMALSAYQQKHDSCRHREMAKRTLA